MGFQANIRMMNESRDFEVSREVDLPHPPRPGMRLRGLFDNAVLVVTTVQLGGDGTFDVEAAVSLMDLFTSDEVKHFASKNQWTVMEPDPEITLIDLPPFPGEFTCQRLNFR